MPHFTPLRTQFLVQPDLENMGAPSREDLHVAPSTTEAMDGGSAAKACYLCDRSLSQLTTSSCCAPSASRPSGTSSRCWDNNISAFQTRSQSSSGGSPEDPCGLAKEDAAHTSFSLWLLGNYGKRGTRGVSEEPPPSFHSCLW